MKIKYPTNVASEFLEREKQEKLTLEQDPQWPQFKAWTNTPDDDRSPTHADLTRLVETMLFASMATEEGHLTPVGIVFAKNLDQVARPAWDLVRFEPSVPFEVSTIAKLGSACGSLESLLVVLPQTEEFVVAGIASPHIRGFFELDRLVRVLILRPGVISVRLDKNEIVRYAHGRIFPTPPRLGSTQLDSIEKAVLQEEPKRDDIEVKDFLLLIVKGMVRLGHGGLLVVLGPKDEPGDLLNEAIQLAGPLGFGAALREEHKAHRIHGQNLKNSHSMDPQTPETRLDHEAWRNAISRVDQLIERIARLTTVDGAVVMSHSLDVLAFGVKISSSRDKADKALTVFEMGPDQCTDNRFPLERRGTRHRAAAIFAEQHPQGLAFIVSQDGDAGIVQQDESKLCYLKLAV